MARIKLCLLSIVLAGLAGFLFSLNGCGSGSPALISGPVQHIVVIFQENRTPDNLFHDPILMSRGADIASSAVNSKGQTIPLTEVNLNGDYDIDHGHRSFLLMYDGGKMDGADLIRVTCDTGTICPQITNAPFRYVYPSQIQPYFQLAEQYTFADRMFQTNQGPSFPAHQFIISGTSAPSVGSDLFVAENPAFGKKVNIAGCLSGEGTVVDLIEPSGYEYPTPNNCFEHPVLSDLLDAKGISWRYYTPSASSIWTGPNAIQHMCQPQTQNGQLACSGGIWSNVVIPQTQVLKDITSHQLAQVSWVIPDGYASDHARGNDGTGPSWVASIVDAIGNSSYWANTVIFITWDDWGGWYDHVPPKVITSYEYGFRVPLIVVSPYAKPGYISHVTHDFGSILKFIEDKFGLPSLGYADALADDLSDCFDFNQTPIKFQTIALPVPMQHFLDDSRAPTDPDDD